MFIFEREFAPQANCPYVFVPSKDMQLDVNGLELSLEPICIEIDKVRFIGAYGQSFMVVSTNNASWHGENPIHDGQEMSGTYLPLQGVLYWDSMQYPGAELVFNDPATTYRPFIEEGKVWKVGWFPESTTTAQRVDSYYFEGDTIVDGHSCKIMKCHHGTANEQFGDPLPPTTEYVGAVYEEGQRVYCAFPGKEKLVLLYDFASAVGETIEIYNGVAAALQEMTKAIITKRTNNDADDYKGTSTFVVLPIPGQESWDDTHPNVWMEGVGNCLAPLNNVLPYGWGNDYYSLMSCTVGDEVIYRMTHFDADIKKQQLDFTHVVKPRPKAPRQGVNEANEEKALTGEYSLKELFVNFKPLAGAYAITICDANGKEVYRKEVQTSNVVGLNTNISGYGKGEYTITVENDAEEYTATFSIGNEDGIRIPTSDLSREEKADAVYDLSGRQVANSKLPISKLPRGIYIRGGKKVVVK